MLKANITDTDDRRAALAMLGFLNGDQAQLHHVMDEAMQDTSGPAALILALAEAATSYVIQVTGSEEEAAKQLNQMVLNIAGKEDHKK